MKFIKYLILLLIAAPLYAAQPTSESLNPEAEKKPSTGFWAAISYWWRIRGEETQRREFIRQVQMYTRNLKDIQNQIKKCSYNLRCKEILSSSDVQRALKIRRKEIIGTLNRSVNDIFSDHGVQTHYDFNKGINTTDEQGNTALHWAMLEDVPAIVTTWLMENGANVNAYNEERITPLMLAVAGLRLDLISLLLQNGADKNFTDADGNNVLQRARNMIKESFVDANLAHAMISILQSTRPRAETVE